MNRCIRCDQETRYSVVLEKGMDPVWIHKGECPPPVVEEEPDPWFLDAPEIPGYEEPVLTPQVGPGVVLSRR